MKSKKLLLKTVGIGLTILMTISNIAYAENKTDENIYERVKRVATKSYTESKEYLPEEYIKDLEALKNMEFLLSKTKENFEVALANENGNYTYVKKADNIKDAIALANSINDEAVAKGSIPVVINKEGIVVYATEAIGRIVKLLNGVPSLDSSTTINVYKNKDDILNGNKEFTYINHQSIDDVVILQQSDNMAQIEANGVTGWIEINSKYSDGKTYTNIISVPVTDAKGRSYYEVVNNELIYYISSDCTSVTGATKKVLGPAPSFLVPGKKYSSYDGNYFYNFEDIGKLISDAKTGNHSNAINSGKPYYNYYLNLPARSKTSYSASELNRYIDALIRDTGVTGSVLAGSGQALIDAQNSYGVNAIVLLAIAINESGIGTSPLAKDYNNIFGANAKDEYPEGATKFNSISECIDLVSSGVLSNLYFNPKAWTYNGGILGDKSIGANVRYASDPFWGMKAATYMYDLDKYLSGGSNLKDYNKYIIGKLTTAGEVKNSQGKVLYQIRESRPIGVEPNSAQVGDFVVVSVVNKNGQTEINPDRSISVDDINPYPGKYDWNVKGYVEANKIALVNSDFENHWAKNEIKYAMEKGWVLTTNNFRPDDSITRAEFIKIVNRAFNYTTKGTVPFTDVKSSDWFYNEVAIALKNGVISFLSNKPTFRPNDPITREEVAVILTNIKNNKDKQIDALNMYSDKNEVSDWALISVEGAIEAGYMGKNVTKFRPQSDVTRAETVVTISRVR